MTAQVYFVWVRGLREPQPQKWHEDSFDVRPETLEHVISTIAISADDALLSLDELAKKFPLPINL
jgi:hypothetical protein